MKYITSEEQLDTKDIVCIYFYGENIPYHKKMITMIDKVEAEYKIKFYALNAFEFSNIAIKRFNVNSVPTVLIINDGKELNRIEGLVLTKAFKAVFRDILLLEKFKSGE